MNRTFHWRRDTANQHVGQFSENKWEQEEIVIRRRLLMRISDHRKKCSCSLPYLIIKLNKFSVYPNWKALYQKSGYSKIVKHLFVLSFEKHRS